MIIVFTAIILAVLLLINYYISDEDLLNPSFLFCGMNFANAMVCVLASAVYDFQFHLNSVAVIIFGVLVFTFFNVFFRIVYRKNGNRSGVVSEAEKNSSRIVYYPKLQRWWIILFILFELLVLYARYDYVMDVGRAYSGSSATLQTAMGVYNRLVKNSRLAELGVSNNVLNTHGYPLSVGVSLILFGIMANNYYAARKKEPRVIVACVFVIFISLLSGARSNAFKLLLSFLLEWEIIRRMHQKCYKKGNAKLLRNIVLLCLAVLVIFFSMAKLLGRASYKNMFVTVVAYIGAPFMNLDIYLQAPWFSTEVWGQETFHNFYSFVEATFHVDGLVYDWYQPYNYHHGIHLGNVYTMYYAYIKDFGFLGLLPMTVIPAAFYNGLYYRVMDFRSKKPALGWPLFLYCYMFGTLLVLTFSHYFYADLLKTSSIRTYLWMTVFWVAFNKIKVRLRNKRLF